MPHRAPIGFFTRRRDVHPVHARMGLQRVPIPKYPKRSIPRTFARGTRVRVGSRNVRLDQNPEVPFKTHNPQLVKTLKSRAGAIFDKIAKSTNVENMLHNLKTYAGLLHRYSAANSALIYWQDPSATLVLSKHDWKRLGRKLKDDAKGILVLIPIGGGRRVSDAEVAHFIERQRKRGISDTEIQLNVQKLIDKGKFIQTSSFGIGRVYDAKALVGTAPLPAKEHLKVSKLYELAKEYGKTQFDIDEGPVGFARGYSNLVKKEDGTLKGAIHVLKVPGEEIQPLDTLIHEMAHHTLSHTRTLSNQEYQKNRGKYEAETQLTSFMVLSHFNIDNATHSAAYIGQWLGEARDRASFGEQAVARSLNAASKIIQGIENYQRSQMKTDTKIEVATIAPTPKATS